MLTPSRAAFVLPLLAAALVSLDPTPAAAPVEVIAHRGASHDAPEHSFAAWDLAIEQGAQWIEQDLQMTHDGVLVVFHDDTLERTARPTTPGDSSCVRRVATKTWRALAGCETGSWFNAEFPARAQPRFLNARIHTLDEVLERYAARGRFYIETKSPEDAPGMEDSLVALLRRRGFIGPGADPTRVRLQSFSAASLERLKALAPELPRVRLLEDRIPVDSLGIVLDDIARHAHGIGPSRRILSPEMIEAAHQRGLFVHVYTVNDPSVMRFMRSAGVDGIFTDRPGLALETFSRP